MVVTALWHLMAHPRPPRSIFDNEKHPQFSTANSKSRGQMHTWQQKRATRNGLSLAQESSLRVEESLSNLVDDGARHVFDVADLMHLPRARARCQHVCTRIEKMPSDTERSTTPSKQNEHSVLCNYRYTLDLGEFASLQAAALQSAFALQ